MDSKRLILAAGLGLAAIVVFTQVKKLNAPAPQTSAPAPKVVVEKVEYVDVLVAATNLRLGSRITEESVRWQQWPAEALTPSLISRNIREEAITEVSKAIVRSPMVAGEPINEAKLVKAGKSGVMAALLKPGMRAVTTRISVDTAAGGFIQPGDRVDIILTQSLQQDNAGAQGGSQRVYVSETIFENVHVLAIDQTFSNSVDGGAAVIGSTATFEMSPDDSELLQESVSKGDLSLTLRGIIGSGAVAQSRAKTTKEEVEAPASMTVYRAGQPQQIAIKGQ